LVLPLVGRIDAARAGAVTQVMLEAIVANASRVVLLDVTGLPFVDAESASHLLGAAQAAELVGAKAILVGVSPSMAQAMVDSGVELGRLATRSNLATGLGLALRSLGKRIVEG
jgi:rsbT co-antagonist protein RsbR